MPIVLPELLEEIPAYIRESNSGVTWEALREGITSVDVSDAVIGIHFHGESARRAVRAEALAGRRDIRDLFTKLFARLELDA